MEKVEKESLYLNNDENDERCLNDDDTECYENVNGYIDDNYVNNNIINPSQQKHLFSDFTYTADTHRKHFYSSTDDINRTIPIRKSSCLQCAVCSNSIDTRRNSDGGFPLRKAASCSICAWEIDEIELNENSSSEEDIPENVEEGATYDNQSEHFTEDEINFSENDFDLRNESELSRNRSNSYSKAMEDEVDANNMDLLTCDNSFTNSSIRLPPEGGEFKEDVIERPAEFVPRSSSPKQKPEGKKKFRKPHISLDKKVSDELDEIFGKLHRSPQNSFDDGDEFNVNGRKKKSKKNVVFKTLLRTPSFMKKNRNKSAVSKSRSVEQLYTSDSLLNFDMKKSVSHMDVSHFYEEEEEDEDQSINKAYIEYLNTINGAVMLGGNNDLRFIWHQISAYQIDLMGPLDDFLKSIVDEIQQTYKKCHDLETTLSLKMQQQEKDTEKIYDDAELAMRQEREQLEEKHFEKEEQTKREFSQMIKSKNQELEDLYKNNTILTEKNENLGAENNGLQQTIIQLEDQNNALVENEMSSTERNEALRKENMLLIEKEKVDQETIQQLQMQLFQTTTNASEIQEKYDGLLLKLRDATEEKELLQLSCTNLTSDLEEMKIKSHQRQFEKQLSWSTNSSIDCDRTSQSTSCEGNYPNHQNKSITDSMSYNKATDSVILLTKPLPHSSRPLSTSSPLTFTDIDEKNRYIQTPSGFTPIRNRDTGKSHAAYNTPIIHTEQLSNSTPYTNPNSSRKRLLFNNQTPIRLASSRQSETEFKVIFTGDPNVGKTSLIRRICHGRFKESRDITYDTDCLTKVITCNNRSVTLKLWDTVGTEKFNSIPPSYFRKSDIVILVYDIMEEDSFWNAKKWLRQIHDYTNENVFLFLVGNKVDFDHKRKIAPKRAECLASENDAMFIETSAKTGENTDRLCDMIASTLLDREETVFIRNDFESSLCSYSFKRSNDVSICCN